MLDRLVALVRRELGAADVRILGAAETAPDATNALVSRMPDGRAVVAVFQTAPDDGPALSRRLGILVATFTESLSDTDRFRPARSPVGSSLHDELRALAERAVARDVLVIDTESPIVWGSAVAGVQPRKASFDEALRDVSHPRLVHVDSEAALPDDESGVLEELVDAGAASDESRTRVDESGTRDDESRARISGSESPDPPRVFHAPPRAVPDAPPSDPTAKLGAFDSDPPAEDDTGPSSASSTQKLAAHALRLLRALPERLTSPKGKPLRHVVREADFGCVAITFSGIYVLVLVFDGDFDELRAERAAQEALPRVERLVLALPPLDPDPQPMGHVVSLRRARRK